MAGTDICQPGQLHDLTGIPSYRVTQGLSQGATSYRQALDYSASLDKSGWPIWPEAGGAGSENVGDYPGNI